MKLHVALIVPLLLLMPLVALAKGGVVPKKSVVIDGLDVDSMRARLDETDMQPLEGIWYYPNEEMTLGIERYHGKHNIGYRIILLESPDINVMPGTVIGYIAATAVDSKYVYRFGKVLPLADPNTYVEDWKGLYSRDKEHIWYAGTLLEDVDYATFDVDKEGNAADKYGPFLHEKRDSTATQP